MIPDYIKIEGENWKPLNGFEEFYLISDFGRVWVIKNKFRTNKSGVIKSTTVEDGYEHIQISMNGKIFYRLVHRLVLEAFVGKCPDGMVACHKDANSLNNRLDNLKWGKHKDNVAELVQSGHHHVAKLSVENIHAIRKMFFEEKISCSKIALKFSVGRRAIADVVNGKTWSHVL